MTVLFLALACVFAVRAHAQVGPRDEAYLIIDVAGGPDAESYPVTTLDEAPADLLSNDDYKTSKIVLRRIPAGVFPMGSPEDELGREPYEQEADEALHRVTLTDAFYIGVFEITQRQYELVTGNNPSEALGEKHPVEKMNWDLVRGGDHPDGNPAPDSFLGGLVARTNLDLELPTEAQWEYACRAGTKTAWNNGTDITEELDDPQLDLLACYRYNDGSEEGNRHQEVGSYLPNAWGLYDMHANVWEWCLDRYAPYTGTEIDPVGPDTGNNRVLRGGAYNATAAGSRAAVRFLTPVHNTRNVGFRIIARDDSAIDLLEEYENDAWINLRGSRGSWVLQPDGTYEIDGTAGGESDFGWLYPLPPGTTSAHIIMTFKLNSVGAIQFNFGEDPENGPGLRYDARLQVATRFQYRAPRQSP